MRVLVLGATGLIGGAVAAALRARGHEVAALSRRSGSAARLAAAGLEPVPGDIRAPEGWVSLTVRGARPVDAVVQAASDFAADLGETEMRLARSLAVAARARRRRLMVIHTGGCWLYPSGAVDEATPQDPLPWFAGVAAAFREMMAHTALTPIAVHPGLVWREGGGALARFIDEARRGGPVRVVGDPSARWPLVHADDLAQLYVLALERGARGDHFMGSAEPGRPQADLAQAAARARGAREMLEIMSVVEAERRIGGWAAGYARDQTVSSDWTRTRLGWRPRRLDAVEGVRDT